MIYQMFELDEAATEELSKSRKIQLSPEVGRTLIEELARKGYEVFDSVDSYYNGIPRSIIVGGDSELPIRHAVIATADRFGLKFNSGYVYKKEFRSRPWHL